jgi:ferritin-like metal-binding protein YciE
MQGLIAEGEEMMGMGGEPMAKDAALIGAAQRVEHYEIAAYGTARQLAGDCGYDGIKDLMDQTLDEESQADSS